jgi:DNA polymerase-1
MPNPIAVDIETDEQDNIVCIGVCDDRGPKVHFDINEGLAALEGKLLVGHGIRADIKWLEPHGFTMANVGWDTLLAEYVMNSNRKAFDLKTLAAEKLGRKWPTYKDVTTSKANIEAACKAKPELYIKTARILKRLGTVTDLKLPKKLTLDKLPRDIVTNYNKEDVSATWELFKFQASRITPMAFKYLEKIELPTAALLNEVEGTGIRVNTTTLVRLHRQYLAGAIKSKKAFQAAVGNGDVLVSSPAQVLAALKRKGLRVSDTNENSLISFKDYPIVRALLGYRKNYKICGTYTKPLYKAAKESSDSRIHCRFMQHTITGRLACREPNLQNQPSAVREAFEAKPGYTFVNADWSQIELRIPAHFSGEPLMVDTFVNNKKKIHEVTAEQIGCDYKVGKTVNFLLTNSGGPARLAQVAEISLEQAEDVMVSFWRKFSTLRDWMEQEKAKAIQAGGIATLYGRWVPIPQLRATDIGVREAAKRQAISVKVQGSAADLMKAAMLRMWKKRQLVPVVTVHDEVMYEVKEQEAEIIAAAVKEEMENVFKLRVPLIADVGIGRTWAEAKAK